MINFTDEVPAYLRRPSRLHAIPAARESARFFRRVDRRSAEIRDRGKGRFRDHVRRLFSQAQRAARDDELRRRGPDHAEGSRDPCGHDRGKSRPEAYRQRVQLASLARELEPSLPARAVERVRANRLHAVGRRARRLHRHRTGTHLRFALVRRIRELGDTAAHIRDQREHAAKERFTS